MSALAQSAQVLPRCRPATLSSLVEQLRAVEATHGRDVVVPLASLSMSEEGSLYVPGQGEHVLNSWSRSQFASMLGLRWDRWFAEASGVERAEEVGRRLRRSKAHARLRTGIWTDGATVRAFVSPTYEVVADSVIAATLLRVLGDAPVARAVVTEMTTSFVLELGEPLRKGGRVGTLQGGLHVRNSDVGYASLAVVAHLSRLVCSNGMTAPVKAGEILRLRHRHVELARIESQLAEGASRLPATLRAAGDALDASANRKLRDVQSEIHTVLAGGHLLRRHEQGAIAAYGREPDPTVFGVAQAITLHAHDVTSEERVALEALAGAYVAESEEGGARPREHGGAQRTFIARGL